MRTTAIPDRFTTLPDEPALQATVVALDQAGIAQQVKTIGGQPDYALGSVHAITRDGTLVIASAPGSQELPGRIHIVLIRQQVGY